MVRFGRRLSFSRRFIIEYCSGRACLLFARNILRLGLRRRWLRLRHSRGRRLVQPAFVRRSLGCFARKLFGGKRLALHHVEVAMAFSGAMPMTAAASGAVFGVSISRPLIALFLCDQRLAVGDRDLIVIGMNFRERQKAMTVAAVVDEGRLQRRLNARDLGEVDVTAKLLAVGAFE